MRHVGGMVAASREVVMAVIVARTAPAANSPARNRTNAAWQRVQIAALRDELLRAEAYADRELSSSEIRRRLTAMLEGREP